MEKKKVVEIEERIPTLKERRKQRANRRLILYVSVFFLLMTMVIYFQSSFSHVKEVEVIGNQHVTEEEVTSLSNLLEDVSIWRYDKDGIEERLEAHPEIGTVTLSRRLPNTIVIQMDELSRIAYVVEDDSYLPVLETGDILRETDRREQPYDAPVIYGFSQEGELREIASELTILSGSLHQRISEIHLSPADNDPLQLKVFMNDGFEVHSTLRNFSERITPYPSIVEELEADQEGVIHMRMSPYFESYTGEEDEGETEE
ncbi:cell division protein FtsQ/DivIB [Alteribacter populi]|uniref:cell division protein FtsQ/DivIB n=1 Tax=Alteribacter populi TaxID=2011011 RepID=UPI000BBA7EE8|nr:FtsQ-type POTRA domain-containing protein [Alteribacter populi]